MLVMARKFSTKATSEKPKKPRKRANSDNPLTLTDYLKQALIGLTLVAKQRCIIRKSH